MHTFDILTTTQNEIVDVTLDARYALHAFENNPEVGRQYQIVDHTLLGAVRSAVRHLGLKVRPGSLLDRALGPFDVD